MRHKRETLVYLASALTSSDFEEAMTFLRGQAAPCASPTAVKGESKGRKITRTLYNLGAGSKWAKLFYTFES